MADADAILEPLRADPSRAAILCDIDGTLAPIVDDPAAAAVPVEAREVLRALAGRYRLVACITGRRASAARRMVGLDELTYAGNHGLELLGPGEARAEPRPGARPPRRAAAGFVATPRLARAREARPAARGQGADPGDPLARGRRTRRPPSSARGGWPSSPAEEGLVPHFGRKVLEMRPLAEVDKGVAARRLVQGAGREPRAVRGRRQHRPRRLRRAARAGARRSPRAGGLRRRRLRRGPGRSSARGRPGRRRHRRVPRPAAAASDAVRRAASERRSCSSQGSPRRSAR